MAEARMNIILKTKPNQSKRSMPPHTETDSPGRASTSVNTRMAKSPPAVSVPRLLRRCSGFQKGSRMRMSTPSSRMSASGMTARN
jgi:hypothetical protein